MAVPNPAESPEQILGRISNYNARCQDGLYRERRYGFCSGSEYMGDPPVRSWLTRIAAPRIALTRILNGVRRQ